MAEIYACLFLIEDDKLLGKEKKTWEKVRNNIKKKERDSEPLERENYLRTKAKSLKKNFFFHNGKIPKKNSDCICLSLILIVSVLKKDENYYPQILLKERKYFAKEEKHPKIYIKEELEIYFDKSDKDLFNA